ncbi:hypothetical protein [Conexibacter woesei]|uniref:Uncharacterized protein n=1 Tax=Conexibacter woesei (strain DSM 14684 / CCUG 47730 / CIP 108061 / JCM 11494 / NBRC 100937 / ID131577) TaxID=469383 RepID=D3F4D3_CONWI|nr:hypothetical protein [Conexibacter woesei]ADB50505.1 hypothetical protein Cwoe_2079 [Conexibacter woesei DSM 14684]
MLDVATLARREGESEQLELLQRMSAEASDTADRCQQVADTRDGLETAIAEKARETKRKVAEFTLTCVGSLGDCRAVPLNRAAAS